MKQLLYYTLDSKFVSDQKAVGGDGDKVVSVVNGVAWTKDERKAYYRYKKPDSGNVTSYTITIHYKDINGNEIASDDVVTVEGYAGYGVSKTITAKSISGYTILTDDVKTFIMEGDIEHTFIYSDTPLEETPLMFYILSSGTIRWTAYSSSYKKTIQYSKNGGEWADITSNTGSSAPSIDVAAGDVVKFRGDNATYGTGSPSYNNNSFGDTTAKFEVGGNIMSLINKTNFATATTLSSSYTFYGLFRNCTSLTSVEKLVLPATTLASGCYGSMFQGCTSLTQAPELPATTLANYCYESMFEYCTSLTTAPELPARTLANYCYNRMFYDCRSLATAPELPATTLARGCYWTMFDSCRSLTQAPELPATTLAYGCYRYMFSGCKSLTQAPELPATTLADYCYESMFYGCTSLTTAPELPATKLADYCHRYMFSACTNLNYVKAMFTTKPGNPYTYDWLAGVASNGTFVKNPEATWDGTISRGPDTVPSGWTITNATS